MKTSPSGKPTHRETASLYLRLAEPCRELFLWFGGVDGLAVGGEPESLEEKSFRKNMKKYNQAVRRLSKITLFRVDSKSTNRRKVELLISDLLAQLQQMMTWPHNWTVFPVDSSKPETTEW